MFKQDYYLGISILIIFLQVLSIIGNGFIIFLFYRNNRLRTLVGLRLIFVLALTDCIFAIAMLPQIIYFIIKWTPDKIDYDGIFVVASGIPLTIQFKVNLMLMIGIALDRIQAIRYPIYYRHKKQTLYIYIILCIGIFWAAVDIVLTYTLKIDTSIHECVAGGCFMSADFKTYWGLGNMILGGIGVVLTIIFAYELRKFRRKKNLRNGSNTEKQLQQTNRLSISIMVISLLFVMTPSILVGITSILGYHIFRDWGPFYTLCLLLTGFINSIIYVTLHMELRKAAIQVIRRKNNTVSPGIVVSTTSQGSNRKQNS